MFQEQNCSQGYYEDFTNDRYTVYLEFYNLLITTYNNYVQMIGHL